MPARTPVPVRMVTAPVRAIRGGGRGTARNEPSRELVAIQQLTREVAVLRGEVVEDPAQERLKAWTYRHRKPLAAVYFGAVLAGAKFLMLGPSFFPLLGLAAAVILLLGSVVWVRRCSTTAPKALLERIPGDYRWRVAPLLTPRAAAVLAAVCGLTWWARPTSLKDASWTWAAAVLVAVVARAARFRIRPALPVMPVPVGPREEWIEHVPAGDKHLENAGVTGPREVINPNGDRIGFVLDVDLPRGAPAATAFSAAVAGRTATTFGVGADMDVVIGLNARNAARFSVTVLDVPGSSALDHVHRYTGSTFATERGTFRLGYRADWSDALIQVFDPAHGARHGHLSGETGGGKSATLELILRNATSSGVIVPLVVDIAQTLGDWADRAPVYVTTREQAVQLLRNMEALHDHRMTKMRDMRMIVDGRDAGARKVYPVDAAHPMYLVPFDEWAHHIGGHKTDPVSKALLVGTEKIVTQTRKTMQGMLLVGQATGLVLGFGNNQNIRTQTQAGYMVAHRNNNESGRQVFGNGLGVDPSTIPMGLYGAAYAASVVDQRDAMCRTEWVEHPGLFDHEIRIPEAPGDELDILRRGLPGGARLDVTVIDVKAAATASAPAAPAAATGRPHLTAVPTTASDRLKVAMRTWAREQKRPVRRGEFVAEFVERRLVASRHKVDTALREMKDAGEFDADAEGYYTIKEAA